MLSSAWPSTHDSRFQWWGSFIQMVPSVHIGVWIGLSILLALVAWRIKDGLGQWSGLVTMQEMGVHYLILSVCRRWFRWSGQWGVWDSHLYIIGQHSWGVEDRVGLLLEDCAVSLQNMQGLYPTSLSPRWRLHMSCLVWLAVWQPKKSSVWSCMTQKSFKSSHLRSCNHQIFGTSVEKMAEIIIWLSKYMLINFLLIDWLIDGCRSIPNTEGVFAVSFNTEASSFTVGNCFNRISPLCWSSTAFSTQSSWTTERLLLLPWHRNITNIISNKF